MCIHALPNMYIKCDWMRMRSTQRLEQSLKSFHSYGDPCLALSQHANREEREGGRRGRLGGRPFGIMLGCEILVDSVIAANPVFDPISCVKLSKNQVKLESHHSKAIVSGHVYQYRRYLQGKDNPKGKS